MRLIKFLLVGVFSVLLLAGCQTGESARLRQMQSNIAKVKPAHVQLEPSDATPYVERALPGYGFWKKDKLETEAEYESRIADGDILGEQVTFFVDPSEIDVMAYPDNGFYVIHTKDIFSPLRYNDMRPTDKKVDCITLASESEYVGTERRSNAFGVEVDVDSFVGKKTLLRIQNLKDISSNTLWKEDANSYFQYFGLPVYTVDPVFREQLKKKRLSLAICGVLGSRSDARLTSDSISPTIDRPVSISHDLWILPIKVTKLYVVDLDTNISVVELVIE